MYYNDCDREWVCYSQHIENSIEQYILQVVLIVPCIRRDIDNIMCRLATSHLITVFNFFPNNGRILHSPAA